MGLIANIKILWKNRELIKTALKATDQVKEVYVKNGLKTTEFWMTIITNIVTIVPLFQGILKPETAAIILAAANGVYGVLRTLTKATASVATVPCPPTSPIQ